MKFAPILFAVLLSLAGIITADAQEGIQQPDPTQGVGVNLRKAVAVALKQEEEEKQIKLAASLPLDGPWQMCDLNLLGFSHHPGGSKQLHGFNPGLGARCWLSFSAFGERWFAEADVIRENSLGGRTYIGGVGAVYRIVGSRAVSFNAGFAAFVANYENPRIHRNLVLAGTAPMVMLEVNGVKLNIVFVPNKGPKDGRGMFAAVLIYASVPFKDIIDIIPR